MKLNDITECERCSGVDIAQLESDLKTAHEMIREFREELKWYSETGKLGQFSIVDDKRQFIDDFANWGKRARAVLQKWQGKL